MITMRHALFFLLSLLFSLALAAQEHVNYPLPSDPDTLRILAIGNSFSDDGTMYLPDLLEGADIHNVIVARLYIGGCSLERHCDEYGGNFSHYKYYKSVANRWETVSEKATLLDGLCDEPWDIVSIQQSSPLSGVWSSYEPWAGKLIDIIRRHCTNPEATIVWHQTWAYATDSRHPHFKDYGKDQAKMVVRINTCLAKLQMSEDIPVVIPTGDLVQMLRGTDLSGEGELTRDGYHLDLDYGRYAAACVWFEALIEPTLGVPVTESRARLEGTKHELDPKKARLCRKMASKAVREFDM